MFLNSEIKTTNKLVSVNNNSKLFITPTTTNVSSNHIHLSPSKQRRGLLPTNTEIEESDDDSAQTYDDDGFDDDDTIEMENPSFSNSSRYFTPTSNNSYSNLSHQFKPRYQPTSSFNSSHYNQSNKSYPDEESMRSAVQQAAILLGNFYSADPLQIIYFAQLQGVQNPYRTSITTTTNSNQYPTSFSSQNFSSNSRQSITSFHQPTKSNFSPDSSFSLNNSDTNVSCMNSIEAQKLTFHNKEDRGYQSHNIHNCFDSTDTHNNNNDNNQSSLLGNGFSGNNSYSNVLSSEFKSSETTLNEKSYNWSGSYSQNLDDQKSLFHFENESELLPEVRVSESKEKDNNNLISMTTPERKYVCIECGKKYKQKSHLIVHRRTHDGIRPYSCDFPDCTKSFVTNSALRAHVRVHSGEKPYACLLSGCGRVFSTNSNLRRHERTHSGVPEQTSP